MRAKFRAALAITVSLFLPPIATADEPGATTWEYFGELFALGADVDVTASSGETIGADFDDILDGLEFAAMATLAARRERTVLFFNYIYADVEDSDGLMLDLGGGPVPVNVEAGVKNLIATLGGGYELVREDARSLSIVGGARYLELDADIKLSVGSTVLAEASDSGSNWDGIIGVRGHMDLSDRWYVHYYADVGTGDSDSTWQAVAGINYRFERLDAVLGYSHMEWDFDSDELLGDLEIGGPYVGIKFRL